MLTYYKVQVIERERGWGQKVDDVKYFRTKPEAETYIKNFNSRNTEPSAPDIYWQAEGPYTESFDEDLIRMLVEDSKKPPKRKK